MTLQIPVTIFVVFAITRIYWQWKNNNVNISVFIFWFTLWAGVLLMVYWPGAMNFVSTQLGVGRGVDAFIYFGLLLSLYLNYRIYIKYEELSQDITKIIRALALKDLEDPKKILARERSHQELCEKVNDNESVTV